MLICRKILQIGIIAALVVGCAGQQRTPATILETTPQALSDSKPTSGLLAVPSANTDTTPPAGPAGLAVAGELRPEVRLYAQQLAAERHLPLKEILSILARAQYNDTTVRLVATPLGQKNRRSWRSYRHRFVEPKRIAAGIAFWEKNCSQLDRAAQQYGVPASIIVSIIGVETFYGRHMGRFKVLDTLTTLAFDHPQPAKLEQVAMFRTQLSDFITLYLRGQISPKINGSYAGAIGMPQFMPGSIMRYAVDGDNDGHIDLVNSVPDAIMSVGNFLQQHGWQRSEPIFAPVMLPPDPSSLVEGGLQPTKDWPVLQRTGARLLPRTSGGLWQRKPLGVINLPEEPNGTTEYRVATENFFALTAYNRSYFYAASVADLAMAIENQRAHQRANHLANSTLP
jgi:membrane-bound lytic murein transglycosylase B